MSYEVRRRRWKQQPAKTGGKGRKVHLVALQELFFVTASMVERRGGVRARQNLSGEELEADEIVFFSATTKKRR
jgi:hypothetical protein